jgi:hypothetical protein
MTTPPRSPRDAETAPAHAEAVSPEPTDAADSRRKQRPKAIAMISGGLDSTLALRMMKDQGVDVHAVNFYTGFCTIESKRSQGKTDRRGQPYRNEALRAAADVGVDVDLVDISEEYMEMVVKPRHGYGSNANPCIDCRIFMLKKARQIMEEEGADFVVTGEVLGQRPMSQRGYTMKLIEREAGLEGKIVRPLTAKAVAATEAEQSGLIDRERLAKITGRSRKPQMALAKKLQITDYPSPAGGCCYLVEEAYARRFYDFLDHMEERRMTPRDAVLLATGRHFRVGPRTKVLVGRDESDNRALDLHRTEEPRLFARDFRGPLTLLQGEITPEHLLSAAQITARYCDGKREESVRIGVERADDEETMTVAPVKEQDLDRWRI